MYELDFYNEGYADAYEEVEDIFLEGYYDALNEYVQTDKSNMTLLSNNIMSAEKNGKKLSDTDVDDMKDSKTARLITDNASLRKNYEKAVDDRNAATKRADEAEISAGNWKNSFEKRDKDFRDSETARKKAEDSAEYERNAKKGAIGQAKKQASRANKAENSLAIQRTAHKKTAKDLIAERARGKKFRKRTAIGAGAAGAVALGAGALALRSRALRKKYEEYLRNTKGNKMGFSEWKKAGKPLQEAFDQGYLDAMYELDLI